MVAIISVSIPLTYVVGAIGRGTLGNLVLVLSGYLIPVRMRI